MFHGSRHTASTKKRGRPSEPSRAEVRTYTDIAVQIGHPSSARAGANAAERTRMHPRSLPSRFARRLHRRLQREGGSEKKRAMLREEGVHI